MEYMSKFKEYLLYERQLAETTIHGYIFFVSEFLKFTSKEVKEICREDIKDFIKYLRNRGIQNSSISNYIISMRQFYNWLADLEREEKIVTLCFFLRKIVRIRRDKTVAEVPTKEELSKLRSTLHAYKQALSFNKKAYGYKIVLRDAAIIEMLIATGARNKEMRQMRVCDVDLKTKTVFIKQGKGGHQRVSVFGDLALETLKEHLEHSSLDPNAAVFVIRNGNMMNYIIKRWALRAGINQELHAHSFRHFHVTEAQKLGVPVQIVADQVGHVNLNTTRHYTHFDVSDRREKYGNCNL